PPASTAPMPTLANNAPPRVTDPSAPGFPTPMGTPVPQPVPSSPAQPTVQGSSRARRESEAPSVKPQSMWDPPTGSSSPGSVPGSVPGSAPGSVADSAPGSAGVTGVHTAANKPHPGVRINQYE